MFYLAAAPQAGMLKASPHLSVIINFSTECSICISATIASETIFNRYYNFNNGSKWIGIPFWFPGN